MAERDISTGTWTAHQSNNIDVRFTLDQNKNGRLSGRAEAIPLEDGERDSGDVVENSVVRGNDVQIIVDWSGGSKGKYVGRFDLSGRLSGNAFDLANPQSQATWFSEETF